jgi:hypothetical protein
MRRPARNPYKNKGVPAPHGPDTPSCQVRLAPEADAMMVADCAHLVLVVHRRAMRHGGGDGGSRAQKAQGDGGGKKGFHGESSDNGLRHAAITRDVPIMAIAFEPGMNR